ncbi:hypothetical protein B0H13DRAFT_1866293 [Mycena leptocephala]|nr:hypothetical protein B0H13DRAFT_1866293 [Mycena leptocephala]
MPRPTITQVRLNNILQCLTAAVTTIEMLSIGLDTSFLRAISSTTRSMLLCVERVKRNKNNCTQLMEQIHKLLYAIIGLHIKSDTGGMLSPSITLHKVHTFIEAQQDRSGIKQFFRQSELNALLQDCNTGLQEALEVFEAFAIGTPRIAILGAGGMGKTSVARAVLHHSQITAIYGQHRIFVACDTVATKTELVAHIGAHLGLKPGKDLTQPVFRHLSGSPPSLIVLDNLETVWDPPEHRRDIEEFLSLLADIKHVALLITMRGAERPAKVQWSRPFLRPLKPLTQDAARKTFIDIAEDAHEYDDIDKLIWLTRKVVPQCYPVGKMRKHH